jgi:hypothetical protein
MNCREFARLVTEVAANRAGAAVHWETKEHAAACPECAARLAEHRDLSVRVKELASCASFAEAPPQVEDLLLSAFRARHGIVPEAPPDKLHHPSRAWVPWAAAAAIIVGTVLSLLLTPPSPQGEVAVTQSKVPPAAPYQTESGAEAVQAEAPVPIPMASSITPSLEKQPFGGGEQAGHQLRSDEHESSQIVQATQMPYREPVNTVQMESAPFLPLLYGGDPMLLQTAPIVRVEMSDAMLQSLGFPIVAAPSGQRIQADLILGDDGVARAIRFVQ